MQKHNYFCTNLNNTQKRVLGRQELGKYCPAGGAFHSGTCNCLGGGGGEGLFSQPEATLGALSFGVHPLIKNVCFAVNSPRELKQITLL